MKLDRNKNGGKYAVIRLRDLMRIHGSESDPAIKVGELASMGLVEFSAPGSKDEFFVVKLRDIYARAALDAYADAAEKDDPEYAAEVRELAQRAGIGHPNSKRPD